MDWNNIIIVDENDRELGSMDKMEAHRLGVLHRAFSIFIFNKAGEMLLQQRAEKKYHSGGLWANACCSHPVPGEETGTAVHRRLVEEMGFDTKLEKVFDFTYKASFDNGLTEHEFDHVYAGEYSGPVLFNTNEVQAVEYVSIEDLKKLIEKNPERFTAWFLIAFPRMLPWWERSYKN